MSIDITPVDDSDRWNDLVERAATPTPFHLAGALDVFADESNATLDRLAAFKGKEPVGLFPLFTKSAGPVTLAFSPPPNLKVNYLGPLLVNPEKGKRRRQELRHSRFLDAVQEWLAAERGPSYTTVRTVPGYDDVRPFLWNDYDATPRYTYVIDLARGADDLLAAFSSDARKNVTSDHDASYTIEEGDHDDVDEILAAVTARHEEQDEPFPIDGAFVRRLDESLPDGVVRPLVCRVDGEFAGGSVLLSFGGRTIRWLGVNDRSFDLPATDLLDWWTIRDAIDRGDVAYDLAGANKKRLSQYKAKFAPDLAPYYRVEAGSRGMTAASKLYSRFR